LCGTLIDVDAEVRRAESIDHQTIDHPPRSAVLDRDDRRAGLPEQGGHEGFGVAHRQIERRTEAAVDVHARPDRDGDVRVVARGEPHVAAARGEGGQHTADHVRERRCRRRTVWLGGDRGGVDVDRLTRLRKEHLSCWVETAATLDDGQSEVLVRAVGEHANQSGVPRRRVEDRRTLVDVGRVRRPEDRDRHGIAACVARNPAHLDARITRGGRDQANGGEK